jgi:hypothetical protein
MRVCTVQKPPRNPSLFEILITPFLRHLLLVLSLLGDWESSFQHTTLPQTPHAISEKVSLGLESAKRVCEFVGELEFQRSAGKTKHG